MNEENAVNEDVKIEKPKAKKPKAKKAQSVVFKPKQTRWILRENGSAIKLLNGQPFEANDPEAIKLLSDAGIPKA